MDPAGTIAYCSREDHWYPAFGHALAALAKQHPDVRLLHMSGTCIADSRNEAVAQMAGAWILFLDSDLVFAPDLLTRLLAADVPVVQALMLGRHPPHDPIPQCDALAAPPGLRAAASLGAGATLYRRSAFARIGPPWFAGPLGHEDLFCCERLRAHGVPLYCDTSITVGHLTPCAITPVWDGHQWITRYVATNGASAMELHAV